MGERLEQTYHQEDMQMAKKHKKRCSTSYVMGDCKLKQWWTTYWMTKTQNIDNTKYW